MSPSSEQLEQESEQTRIRLAETLDELRGRLSPGQVVDQLVDYARDGGAAEFVRNLGHEVRRNPLPVTLIGAGISWLIMANGRSLRNDAGWHAGGSDARGIAAADPQGNRAAATTGGFFSRLRARGHAAIDDVQSKAQAGGEIGQKTFAGVAEGISDAADTIGENVQNIGSSAADTAHEASRRISGAARHAASTAASAKDTAAQSATSLYHAATDAAHGVGDSASRVSRNAGAVTRSLADFCAEQPLVTAGLGLALGAAIGAALPASETEDRLIGKTSDALKDSVQEQASELYQKAHTVARDVAQNVAHDTVEAVGKAAEDEGLIDPARSKSVAEAGASGATSPAAS
jgi:hypothetical protein